MNQHAPTVTKCSVRGRKMWQVYHRVAGKRKRAFFASRESADAEAQRLGAQIQQVGHAWLDMKPSERSDIISIWNQIKEAGLTLREVWAQFQAIPKQGVSPLLRDAITELVSLKTKAGRAGRYTSSLKTILKQFAMGRETQTVAELGVTDIEKFLDSKALASRSTLRARLSTLFKFCVRRGYRIDNPCAKLEAVTVTKATPEIFTAKQIAQCLKWLKKHEPKGLPWFVLSSCCGLRPEEAEKTRRKDIHAKEGWIRVEAQTTKVRQRRIVYPKPEAMNLLQSVIERGSLPIAHGKRRTIMRDLRKKALKLKVWPKDITRHTAASYWLADCGSAAQVSEALGNSEGVLKRDYKALVTREQAKKFWTVVQKHSNKAVKKVKSQ